MEKLAVCRVCLSGHVHRIIENRLQEVYEKLTAIPLQTNDMRPMSVCYVCYARLNKSYKLMLQCIKADNILTQMLDQVLNREDEDKTTLLDRLTLKSSQLSVSGVEQINIVCEMEDADKTKEIKQDCDVEFVSENVQLQQLSGTDQINMLRGTEDTDVENNIKQEVDIELGSENFQPASGPEQINTVSGNEVTDINNKLKQEIDVEFVSEAFQQVFGTELINVVSEVADTDIKNELKQEFDVKFESEDIEQIADPLAKDTESNLINSTKNNNELPAIGSTAGFECILPRNTDPLAKDTESNLIIFTKNNNKLPEIRSMDGFEFILPSNTDPLATTDTEPNLIIFTNHNNEMGLIAGLECNLPSNTGENHRCLISSHISLTAFACDVCQKNFISKSALNQHRRTHPVNKAFSCHLCSKRFILRSNLERHIKMHNSRVEIYRCKICFKICRSFNGLIKHHNRCFFR